ncbi:hypothetical protein [Lysobacter enzymogenes]|uniref:hypothetical protein n=1 Tax=Lysobacter enzymogenes TaxID=69 RepID=UPI0011AB7C4C|nr:hypothetical protein [Lysobacter enzymogenes]
MRAGFVCPKEAARPRQGAPAEGFAFEKRENIRENLCFCVSGENCDRRWKNRAAIASRGKRESRFARVVAAQADQDRHDTDAAQRKARQGTQRFRTFG